MPRSIATPCSVRQQRAVARALAGIVLAAGCRREEPPRADAGAVRVVVVAASAVGDVGPLREVGGAMVRMRPDAPRPFDAGAPSTVVHADAGEVPRGAGFLGMSDDAVLSRICDAPVERIERNRGGSTVSFRVWFAGGQRGLFKPQQRSEVANFRAELAAYRMSRLLGFHRVPPACGRTLPRELLQRTADRSGDAAFSTRVMTELLGRSDAVPGAMLYWVPGSLEPVPGVERYAALLGGDPVPEADRTLARELSDLLLFDFLNDNVDRWSGGNILRQRSAPGALPGITSPMLFMDNGASFSALHDGLGARPQDQAGRLDRVQRFSRSTVEALRAITPVSLRRAMADDPLGPCLSELQQSAVIARKTRVLRHVEAVIAARGEVEALSLR